VVWFRLCRVRLLARGAAPVRHTPCPSLMQEYGNGVGQGSGAFVIGVSWFALREGVGGGGGIERKSRQSHLEGEALSRCRELFRVIGDQ
jgi:hypothetical protein